MESFGMKIACIGGGPGGLMVAIATKRRLPTADIHVYERNRLGDTFGFGVVFSDETLANIAAADPEGFGAIEAEFRYWSDLEVRIAGQSHISGGHGFAALSRVRLLAILSHRAEELGVHLHYESDVDAEKVRDADIVVGADGVNSATRTSYQSVFRPTITYGPARFFWSGTDAPFDRFTFLFEQTDNGYVQAHCYPFDNARSTFIVEIAEDNFQSTGLSAARNLAIGESDLQAIRFGETVFADSLNGHGLIGNNTKWLQFPRVSCKTWSYENIVLVGDAVHTAHYSIGSGTKLALEDAIVLSDAIVEESSVASALERYESKRKPTVDSLQRAAVISEEWFQHVDSYVDRPPKQFVLSCLTRSQRVTLGNLGERDPGFASDVLDDERRRQSATLGKEDLSSEPFLWPLDLAGVRIPNRVVVAPMMQYSATDGVVDDWHLVHYGSRAIGGAGLVMAETAFISPDARATPGCAGIWTDEQAAAWSRIVGFTHRHTDALIGLQIGHAGRRGSRSVPWEGGGPLGTKGWPTIGPSPLPYSIDDPVPREIGNADMDEVRVGFVDAARRADAAGFDVLEIHAGHGQLLSSFLSPISNQRTDDFGGSLNNRARFPLDVVRAVREVWPKTKPLIVRISATDWIEGGFGRSDALEFSKLLKQAGVDAIDVSGGEVDERERPPFGRLYLTPLSDAIRNQVGIPTLAVGNVASIDDVNTIIVAGRADLCMIGRPHLIDPYWTMNAAIDVHEPTAELPRQYEFGATARRRQQDAAN